MRRPLKTLAQLWSEPLLTAEAVATRLSLMAELRTRAIDAIAQAPAARTRPRPEDIVRIGQIGELVTTRIPGLRSRCLARALVRFRMLRRRGHDVHFVMGIDPALPDLEGHAWVEIGGEPLYETTPATCTVTLRSP